MRQALGFVCAVVAVAACSFSAGAADWPQWRGPQRQGVAPAGPVLVGGWPKDGPTKLWQSEKFPSADDGGYASVSVADGRAYMYVNFKYRVPVLTRKLTEAALTQLGWSAEKLPDALRQAVEQARVSEERVQLKNDAVGPWIDAWIAGKLDKDQKKFEPYVRARLSKDKDALGLDLLDKLAGIRDKEFPTQAALNQWFDDNGIAGPAKSRVMTGIPSHQEQAKDIVYGLSAADGSTLWRVEYPGKVYSADGRAASSTVCVADGKCYLLGSGGQAFCLDAKTGKEIWKAPAEAGQSSFVLVDGLAVTMCKKLTAFDALTGKVVWTQEKVHSIENSVNLWHSGDTTYLICNTDSLVYCVNPKDGQILWSADGGGYSTPAIEGDAMVILSGRKEVGLTAYKLSPQKAEKLWNIPELIDRGASPILHDGHAYAVAGKKASCVNLQTGKILWEGKPGAGDISSPILVGDKMLAILNDGKALVMLNGTPEKYELLAKSTMLITACSSPAIVDGKLFLRMRYGVSCFDLTQAATTTTTSAEAGK